MKKMKYVISMLMLASISVYFINLIKLDTLYRSLFYFTGIGLGKIKKGKLLGVELSVIQGDMEVFSYSIFALLIIILIGCIFVTILPKKMSYYISIIFSMINSIGLFFLIWILKSKLAAFYEAEITLERNPLYIWGGIYAVILIISIIIIAIPEKKKSEDRRKVFREEALEDISPMISLVNQEKKSSVQLQKDAMVQNKEVQQNIMPKQVFHGAIVGTSAPYIGKVFPLEEKKQVFFALLNEQIIVSERKEGRVLASVYYVDEYREYCVTADESLCVFLKSGQPIGRGRDYYLPRGMDIYLLDRKNTFMFG